MAHFKYQIASDIVRNGLGLELLNAEGDVLAEVFRCDKDHTVIISTFGNDLPAFEVEALISKAKSELDPFEDGTPLQSAFSVGSGET
ncbi:MAG: hypothetical protein ACE5OQ_11800 [Woeseia sp.]